MERQERSNRFDLDRKATLAKFCKTVENLNEDIELFSTLNVDDTKENNIVPFITAYIELLVDGFEPRSTPQNISHFWQILPEVFKTKTISNINTLEEYPSDPERAYIWILIQLNEKKILSDFQELSNNIIFLQYYSPKALIKSEKAQIEISLKSLTMNEYKIESKFLKVYKAEYIDRRRSSVWRVQDPPNLNRTTKSITTAAKDNLANYKKLLNKDRKQTDDWDSGEVYVNPNTKDEYNQAEKTNVLTKFGEDLIKLPVGLVSTTGDIIMKIPGTLLKIPKKLPGMNFFRKDSRKVRRSLSGDREKKLDDDDDDLESPGNRNFRGLTTKIIKAVDIRDKLKPLNPLNFLNKKKDFDDGEEPNPQEESILVHNQDDYDAIGLMLEQEAKKGRLKNSKILFYEQYASKLKMYEYPSPPTEVTKPEDQGNKCYSCGAELSKIMLLIKEKSFFCHYTGHWYCYDCMSKEKALIPWYVKESFDFKQYHVSKDSYQELKKLFNKHIITIDYTSVAVQKNKILYETLLMKRQVHLMYDLICDTLFMFDIFGEQSNLLLKENLFSLKQLRETKDGALIKFLEDKYTIIDRHMRSCSICSKKTKPCIICYNEVKIAVYDIKNTSICPKCKNLFHSKCLKQNGCSYCQHNA